MNDWKDLLDFDVEIISSWDDWTGCVNPPVKSSTTDKLTTDQKWCTHNWKTTLLIRTTVTDCTKCNVKKEDYDDYMRSK